MTRKSSKKNYLTVKVRVSYDEETDSIHITSKNKNKEFDVSLNESSNRLNSYILHDVLLKAGLMDEAFPPLYADFRDSVQTDLWDKFPMGILSKNEESVWDSSLSPNLLITGTAGGGKSVIQRNIIFHCHKHSENWEFYGIDLLRVELTPYLKLGAPIRNISVTISEALETIQNISNEMDKRYQRMEQNSVCNFLELHNPPPAIMLMIDEASYLLRKTFSKTIDGMIEDKQKDEMKVLISRILTLGHASGIHIVMATQRLEFLVSGNFLDGFASRIAAGRLDETASQALLGNNRATTISREIRGRGHFQQFGKGRDIQSYYTPFKI